MRLHDFQQGFIESVKMKDIAPITAAHPSCRLNVSDGLSIYAANMTDGLMEILGETYVSVKKLVGDDFFKHMAKDFIAQNLPDNGNMNLYGPSFPKFIETYKPALSLPYLPDIARFEWAWNDSYFAIDDADLDISQLSNLTPEDYQQIGIIFKASVHFLVSDYPVDLIWQFCNSDGRDGTLNIHSDNVFLMIWRTSMEVQTLRLSKAEYLFLVSLKIGIGMLMSLEYALREDPYFHGSDFIKKLFNLKTVQSISLPSKDINKC